MNMPTLCAKHKDLIFVAERSDGTDTAPDFDTAAGSPVEAAMRLNVVADPLPAVHISAFRLTHLTSFGLEVNHALPGTKNLAYVQANGTYCPNCRSEDIASNPPTREGPTVTQSTACLECATTWTDHFNLQQPSDFGHDTDDFRNAKYLSNKSFRCPNCADHHIKPEAVETIDTPTPGTFCVHISCPSCLSTWRENWNINSITDFQRNAPSEEPA
jgi:hypothetical protein